MLLEIVILRRMRGGSSGRLNEICSIQIYIFAHGVKDWLAINLKSKQMFAVDDDQNSLDWNVVLLVACWLIWKWRCKRLFEAWLLSSSSTW